MRQLTPADMAKTGLRAIWCGQVLMKWKLTDTDTGELLEGAKIVWMGGNGSVRFGDPREMDLFVDGDLIEVEVQLIENKGSFKPGKGNLLRVNGTKISDGKKVA